MRVLPILLAASALGGCKFAELPRVDEDGASTDATGGGDGGEVDADTTDARPPRVSAVAIGTDYANPGTLGAIDVATVALTPDIAPTVVASDPSLRFLGDDVFLVNRYVGGNVVILDPDDWSVSFSGVTGASTNPQDVAVAGDKLFVPALATSGIRVLERANPQTIRSIDLSTLDPDGRPDCNSAYAVGNTVIVTCGLLDATFTPRGNGVVVYIDATTETVIETRTMPVPNPLGLLQPTPAGGPLGGDLLIPSHDYTPPNDGCLLRIPTTPGPSSCLLTNAMLGNNVGGMVASVNGSVIYMVVNGALRTYDVLGASLSPAGAMGPYNSLGVCPDDTVMLGQTMGTQGVRLFRNGVELTTAPLALGKPPAFGNSISCYRR